MIAALVKEYPTEYRLVYLLGAAYDEAKADAKALEILRGIPAAGGSSSPTPRSASR